MATRSPLVLVDGTVRELPNGDTITGAGAVDPAVSVYIQEADPMAATPYIWFRTDAMGVVIDILKG